MMMVLLTIPEGFIDIVAEVQILVQNISLQKKYTTTDGVEDYRYVDNR